MTEIWKELKEYNSYCVSNHGRIKSKRGDVKRPTKDKKGYLIVCLWCNGKPMTKQLHRLIAKTFIDNPESKPAVNHINGVKDDNRVENLEWVTAKENIHHALRTGLSSPMKATPVLRKSIDGQLIKEYESSTAASFDGFCAASVRSCLSGRLKTYKGFRWEYKP